MDPRPSNSEYLRENKQFPTFPDPRNINWLAPAMPPPPTPGYQPNSPGQMPQGKGGIAGWDPIGGMQRLIADLQSKPVDTAKSLGSSLMSASPGLGVPGARIPFPKMTMLPKVPTPGPLMQQLVKNPESWGFKQYEQFMPKLANALRTNPRILANFMERSLPKSLGYVQPLEPTLRKGTEGNPVPMNIVLDPAKAALETLTHEAGHASALGLGKQVPNPAKSDTDALRILEFIRKQLSERPGTPSLPQLMKEYKFDPSHAGLEAAAIRAAHRLNPNAIYHQPVETLK